MATSMRQVWRRLVRRWRLDLLALIRPSEWATMVAAVALFSLTRRSVFERDDVTGLEWALLAVLFAAAIAAVFAVLNSLADREIAKMQFDALFKSTENIVQMQGESAKTIRALFDGHVQPLNTEIYDREGIIDRIIDAILRHDGHTKATISLLAHILTTITPDDERPDLIQMLRDLRVAGPGSDDPPDEIVEGFRRVLERIEEELTGTSAAEPDI